jgi:hypothetical protein
LERSAADHQSSHCHFEADGQQPTNESELSRSAVPSIPSQAGYPRRDQGHGREASPSGLSHASLRNQIRRLGSTVLRSSTAYPTDQASQAESCQAWIPTGPGSRLLKHQLREFLERTSRDRSVNVIGRIAEHPHWNRKIHTIKLGSRLIANDPTSEVMRDCLQLAYLLADVGRILSSRSSSRLCGDTILAFLLLRVGGPSNGLRLPGGKP